MKELTIQLPETLAERLSFVAERVPEIVERGLDNLPSVPNQIYQNILEFLVGNPSPEEMLAFSPTPQMVARVNLLLEQNRQGKLAERETRELDEYVKINHLITMMKARAIPYLGAKN